MLRSLIINSNTIIIYYINKNTIVTYHINNITIMIYYINNNRLNKYSPAFRSSDVQSNVKTNHTWKQVSQSLCTNDSSPKVPTEKSLRNLIESTRNHIVFTIFQFIWSQTHVRLVPNQSENGIYNLIWVSFNKISKRFLYM